MYGSNYFASVYFAGFTPYNINSNYKYVSDSVVGVDTVVMTNTTPPIINLFPTVKAIVPF